MHTQDSPQRGTAGEPGHSGEFMTVIKRAIAGGATAAIIGGSLFFGAAPAAATHESQACLTAEAQFQSALERTAVESGAGELVAQLLITLEQLYTAAEARDTAETSAEAGLTATDAALAAELQAQADVLVPELNAVLAGNADPASLPGRAQALLVLLAAGDLVAIAAAEPELEAVLGRDVVVDPLTADDVAALTVEVQGVLDGLLFETRTVLALLEAGDAAGLVAAEATIESLLGRDVDFAAIASLLAQQDALLDSVDEANAAVDAAVAAFQSIINQLQALNIDTAALESQMAAVEDACAGAETAIVPAAEAAPKAVAPAPVAQVRINRGLNIQSAAGEKDDAAPAFAVGGVLLLAGGVAAVAIRARRKARSES